VLTFYPDGHLYKWRGTAVPSVTQVIDGLLRDYSGIPPQVLKRAGELGTLVHLATALDAEGKLDEDSVDPEVAPYVAAWRKFLKDSGAKVLWSEQPMYHPLYGYAGTPDHGVKINGDVGILDKKTGIQSEADVVQTAAYYSMVLHNEPRKYKQTLANRWALYLRKNGTYKLVRHNGPGQGAEALQIFLGCLSIYKWRKARNILNLLPEHAA